MNGSGVVQQGRSRNYFLLDKIVAGDNRGSTLDADHLILPSHASRSLGLKNEYFSPTLHFWLHEHFINTNRHKKQEPL